MSNYVFKSCLVQYCHKLYIQKWVKICLLEINLAASQPFLSYCPPTHPLNLCKVTNIQKRFVPFHNYHRLSKEGGWPKIVPIGQAIGRGYGITGLKFTYIYVKESQSKHIVFEDCPSTNIIHWPRKNIRSNSKESVVHKARRERVQL